MKNSIRILGVILTLAVMASLIAGCKGEEKKVVIASKPMTEQYILAEMLSQIIENKTDIKVELKAGIAGGTSNIHPGMESGEIDIYPEYTGTGWLFVLKKDPIQDMNELYESVKNDYLENYQIVWTGMYGFNNTYGLAVSSEVAQEYDLVTMSDLAEVSSELTFAANPDFYERDDGYEAMVQAYGFSFGDTTEIDIGLRYEALSSEDADVITVFTTDARINEGKAVVLEDDKSYFKAYHGATLVRQETLDTYPELLPVLELLTGQISNEEMIAMNYKVEIENDDPKAVAEEFLRDKGLVD